MWTKIPTAQSTLLPHFIHYMVGGCIYVLDRVIEDNRYDRIEGFIVDPLTNLERNPHFMEEKSTKEILDKFAPYRSFRFN